MKNKSRTVSKNFRFTAKQSQALRKHSTITGKSQTRIVLEAIKEKVKEFGYD